MELAPPMQIATTLRILSDGRLEAIPQDGARGSDDQTWTDRVLHDEGELLQWLEGNQVPKFLLELICDPHASEVVGDQSGGALLTDSGGYFYFPFYGQKGGRLDCFRGVCLKGRLLTFHAEPFPLFETALDVAKVGDILPAPTTSGVFCALARFAATRSTKQWNHLSELVTSLSTRLGSRESDVTLREILDVQGAVRQLDAALDEQLATFRALSLGNSSVLDLSNLSQHIAVTITNLESLTRAMDRLDRHADSVRAQYDSHLSERTNRRLATLTVLSAVYMPLTLIAGIYGMNFESMPELSLPGAYPITLGVMAAIALGLSLFFWRRGWFD